MDKKMDESETSDNSLLNYHALGHFMNVYGWTILVTIIAIGVIAYFVFSGNYSHASTEFKADYPDGKVLIEISAPQEGNVSRTTVYCNEFEKAQPTNIDTIAFPTMCALIETSTVSEDLFNYYKILLAKYHQCYVFPSGDIIWRMGDCGV